MVFTTGLQALLNLDKKFKKRRKRKDEEQIYEKTDSTLHSSYLSMQLCSCDSTCSTETVQAEAATAKSSAKVLTKSFAKALDKVIKTQKFTAKTTDKQKLQKLFNYTKKAFGYKRYMGGIPSASGWDSKFAQEMLKTKAGSCYHDAAAFAYLARRATGLPVRICVGTSNAFNKTRWQNHGWVEIKVGNKWYTFDTNANRFSSLRKGKWFMQKRNAMKGKVYKTQKTYNVNF